MVMEIVMNTYFLSPERSTVAELNNEMNIVVNNPIVSALMNAINAYLLVFNKNRQIVASNDSFLKSMNSNSCRVVLGLRLGEALRCVYSDRMEAGCGTSEYCLTCGVAVATVSCLTENIPIERECALQVKNNGTEKDLFYEVKAYPFDVENMKFILLFLDDKTNEQNLINLERVFFHDIQNIITGIVLSCELINRAKNKDNILKRAEKIQLMSLRLSREVEMQRSLIYSNSYECKPEYTDITLTQVFCELNSFFSDHKVANEKSIIFPDKIPQLILRTDLTIL